MQGLKRLKHDEEKLDGFVKTHVSRLLKLDTIAVLGELERQEVSLAIKVLSLSVLLAPSSALTAFSLYVLYACWHVHAVLWELDRIVNRKMDS
ncbi:hypothetical protein CDL15_Pgr010388 [Punica granatum]|uniref:Uncharacterized protein n=1 Tax=Punica granatum TaxID=22663 RepID=A0A218W1M8_PUNGR|nr:hypothetical protein CDL15_Pgr010388 [Punica granatum]